jgi:hypothetical protein
LDFVIRVSRAGEDGKIFATDIVIVVEFLFEIFAIEGSNLFYLAENLRAVERY